ncbi:MAG: type transport system permease protein [Thermomicrobiales bacterium]|jgi:ABC-2 type transport system permease protein|nr:type transport system permease protein [Thermomicrobiales bacterium]
MILRTKVRIRRHQFRIAVARHPGTVALQTFAVIPALLVVGLLLFSGIGSVLSRVPDEHDASAMLATLLTLTAVTAFIGSSTTALQSLYLSNDLPFLMTLPVPLRVLYGSKLVESLAGAVPAACFGFVVLAAYGASRAESVLFFPAALLAEALVVAMATTVAVIVVALVTRLIPARRARLFLFGISLTIVGSTVLVWNAVAPSQQDLQLGGGDRSMAAVGESLVWLPTAWLAKAVAAAAAGDPHRALSAGAGAAAATVVAVVTSYQIFSRSFAKSVAMARATAAPRSSQTLARRLSALVRLLPQDIGALVVKEWLTLLRDLKRLSGVIWPLGVVAVYAVTSSRQHPMADDGALRFWQANAAVALVPWAISLGLSLYAFGSEQRAINLLRLLPFGPRRLFAGKVLAALVPVTLLSEVIALVVVLAAGGGWREVGGMMVLVAWGSVGFVTIDTAAAAFAPNFEADHIQRSTELVGRAFGMVAGAAFGLLSAVAVGRVIIFVAGTPPALQQALGWQVAGLNPLGWPLVIGAVVGALTILIVVVGIAFDRIRDLILNGP